MIAIPVGILLTRITSDTFKNSIFNIANIFQTIPTIALLALFVPLLGIGMPPAIVALFLFSLLPLLRNTYAGMQSVSEDIKESAKGMGYNSFQQLWKIEFKIAFPYIMSGLRMTTVYVISWTTIAAVIGAGGLGGLVMSGLSMNDAYYIFTGTILAVILALIVDFIMSKVEKKIIY
ncbi:ABC transporter permease [Salicibibacter cibi]|uniref:ABC transporter permease n=2 Tax=Salicibibacter cibi TaxID=2743001 RepID=A0A7T7CH95_9BACI|nr:ABC transporter permease [Salicibibacter cibi]